MSQNNYVIADTTNLDDLSKIDLDYNISPQQQPLKKKKIVIGLPGNNFSSKFLISFISTLNSLWESNKYDIVIAPATGSCVHHVRMKTLGLDVLKGVGQKPFDGMEFDYWITIDSDIVFTFQQFFELINSLETHSVVSAMYRMEDLTHYPIVKNWDTDYFCKNGTFEFLTPEYVENWKKETGLKYMLVNYTGMGFFGMRSEVLNKMTYPYFDSEVQEIVKEDGTILRDICSEDVAFCKNINKLGYNILINTDIRVGHEKRLVI